MLNRLMILPKGRAQAAERHSQSGPENDGGTAQLGRGSSAKSGNQTPPDAVTATN